MAFYKAESLLNQRMKWQHKLEAVVKLLVIAAVQEAGYPASYIEGRKLNFRVGNGKVELAK
ncbi:hypothetical protein BKE38_08630 [Pseudoroseomonas deserti]|uniref:Uncharacterized protein n=2 Tax=Teichococcus deserti TaxID=1817963 RepID=A0A1V2H4V0_9PROT|nr:hypothetical protein BKE38_08630 [Pseudoroseomonas deserti]